METRNDRPTPLRTQDVRDESFFVEHRRALVGALFVVHLVATLFFFAPADIFNDRPVVTLDHAFHYYQAWRAREVFPRSGRLHAYDPHFMAGFPSALFDLDVKSLEAFCALFPKGEVPRATKIYILACYLSIVFTVYGGCRLMRLSERESVLAAALTLAFWHWGRPYASHFRYAGMFNFVLASHLALVAAGLFRRFLGGGGVLWWLVAGPLVCFVHPTVVVLLAAPYACLVYCERRRLTLKVVLLFAAWSVLVVALNSVWIVPLLRYASLKTETRAYFQTAGVAELARVLFRPGCLPAVALLALAVPGGWRLVRSRRGPEAAAMAVAVMFLLALAAYGVFLPGIEHLEPGRFLLPALFFSAPLAGAGAAVVLDGWARFSERAEKLRSLARAALVVLALCPVLLSYLSARTGYRHRVSTSFTPEVQSLVDAVRRYADRSGRLMIEDGPAALYGECHLPGILPVYTGIEQIGGPYPFTFIAHHFATFQRDRTMGKPLCDVSPAQFAAYADLYNIRWIVTASSEAESFVQRMASVATPDSAVGADAGASNLLGERAAGGSLDGERDGSVPLVALWRSGRYTLWRVDRAPTFTGFADDRVTAGFDSIRIALAEERAGFLLRYHWDRGLEARGRARVRPLHRLDDPVPFLWVEPNGETSIEVVYRAVGARGAQD